MRVNPDALRAIRERTGMSQSDLAIASDIPKETMSRLEAGQRSGTERQIKSLAEALMVPITAIINFDRAPKSDDAAA